ncbi:hypothetical protein MCAV_02720 [[Mycoplasma] cavipharyngis]|uniref:hypothetical protein n=1 Tax=[Mycoplasma] cavipharyngis TaxID=92757 RepID=UPI0037047E56
MTRIQTYFIRIINSNFWSTNRYLYITAVIWGIIALLITVIIGLVSQKNPVLAVEIIDKTSVYHSFSINSAPDSAFICLGISLFFSMIIFFVLKRRYSTNLASGQINYVRWTAISFLLTTIVFHLIAFLLAYFVFYYPQLASLEAINKMKNNN